MWMENPCGPTYGRNSPLGRRAGRFACVQAAGPVRALHKLPENQTLGRASRAVRHSGDLDAAAPCERTGP